MSDWSISDTPVREVAARRDYSIVRLSGDETTDWRRSPAQSVDDAVSRLELSIT